MDAPADVAAREAVDDDDDEGENEDQELALNLDIVRDGFTPGAEGEVPLHSYLTAFHEMNKFIKLLGPLFHFVTYDIKRKITLVRNYMASEEGRHYVDVRTMLDYETEQDIALRTSPQSGADAVLQLNRGLEFTREFMKELLKEDEKEEVSLGQVTSRIYLATVGRFHVTILARTFSGVLLLMPSRATIRSRVAKEKEEAEETLKNKLPEVIKAVTATHQACQELYRRHDLLDMK